MELVYEQTVITSSIPESQQETSVRGEFDNKTSRAVYRILGCAR